MKTREDIYKITSIILMLDQFIKILINKYMELGSGINIIPNFFSLIYIKNTGAAFSILKDNTFILTITSVIIIIILDRFIKKEENLNKLSIISFGLIMGGIFGNLIDRIIHHGVIDYLSFKIFNYHFPIFNLADITIVGGVFLLLISMIKERSTISSNK